MSVFLETPRLILRAFTEDDAGDLFALDNDPEVMRFIGPFQLADPAAYREHIRTKFLPYYARYPGYGFWATAEKESGAFLRVMEKTGLKRVGEFRIPGYDQPSVKYALSRDEYRAQAADDAPG